MDYRCVTLICTIFTALIPCAVLIRDWAHDKNEKSRHYKGVTLVAIALTVIAALGSGWATIKDWHRRQPQPEYLLSLNGTRFTAGDQLTIPPGLLELKFMVANGGDAQAEGLSIVFFS